MNWVGDIYLFFSDYSNKIWPEICPIANWSKVDVNLIEKRIDINNFEKIENVGVFPPLVHFQCTLNELSMNF